MPSCLSLHLVKVACRITAFWEHGITQLKMHPLVFKRVMIDGTKVSFTSQVEHEQISIVLDLVDDQLIGEVRASEGAMSIVMVKKGAKAGNQIDETAIDTIESQTIELEGIGRYNLIEDGENK